MAIPCSQFFAVFSLRQRARFASNVLLGRLPERRDFGLAFLSERIAAGPRQFAIHEGFVPRFGQS